MRGMRAAIPCCTCVARTVTSVSQYGDSRKLVAKVLSRSPQAAPADVADISLDANQRGRYATAALGHFERPARLRKIAGGIAGRAGRGLAVASGECRASQGATAVS